MVGGANYDFLVRGGRLPKPGETTQGEALHEGSGGKGANQAIAAARAGARVALIARVGVDARGDAVVEAVGREGVDVRWVRRDTVAPTGVALIMVGDDGEKQIHVAPGANLRLTPADLPPDALEDAVVVLAQFEAPPATIEVALRRARLGGARTVLDPAPPRPGAEEVVAHAHVVRPNAVEARSLTGVEVVDFESASLAARTLLGRGAVAAIVQAGDAGDVLVFHSDDRTEERRLPRFEVPTVDATGAGDVFAGSLAAMLAQQRPLPDACVYAGAAAALKTTKVGATSGPLRSEVLSFLASNR